MWALFEGTAAVARDDAKIGTERDMEKTLRLLRQMREPRDFSIAVAILDAAGNQLSGVSLQFRLGYSCVE